MRNQPSLLPLQRDPDGVLVLFCPLDLSEVGHHAAAACRQCM